MRASAFLLSAATFAIAVPASAQDVPTTPAEAQVPAQGTANAAVGEQTSDATDADTTRAAAQAPLNAGDIVVTATRRAERLSDVPIAVSAIGQESLQNSGATDIRALGQLAPSLLVSSTGSEANASARIRGIGTVGDNPGLESSVAVFIDGVYRSRTGSGLNDLGEVDRIEVLRGPQGTLFGRNASAGLINIITKAPSYTFGGYGEATYGNYNNVRLAGAVTGPIIPDMLAFRIDGVFNKRDGFLYDVVNNTDYNDRNRYFVRGQLLFEPSSDIAVRLIGDFTRRDEKCCGAVYVDLREKIDPTPGVPGDFAINPAGNRIVQVMQQLGAVFPSAGDPYNRRIANSPGRAYGNVTKDYGGSMQIDWNLGGASLTSITAYREYKSGNAADIDYGSLDIGYRDDDGNAFRQFHTFTQELRLQGSAFDGKLDWLVGGFYSNEDLVVRDNLQFGSQYGLFAACRIVATVNPAAALRSTTPGSGCLSPIGQGALTQQLGAAAPLIIGNLRRLSTLNNLGDTRADYYQDSENYAAFTHNIFRLTDTISITAGLRYTREQKAFRAFFNNTNTLCPQLQAGTAQGGLGGLLANPALASLAGGIITLGCTGNSSSALNALNLNDSFKEDQLTGTGVLSWKPNNNWLVYASYSRGYKAGGYNLDRSDLGTALFPRSNADVRNLRFDPELVNAYEAGFKFTSADFTLNVAAFRSDFDNFQLNTFNGTNFVVENIGSCSTSLNGGDRDASATTGACTSDVKFGVRSQGVEVEAGLYPARNFSVNMGYTFADTRLRRNLVGSAAGAPLDPALFLLPGNQLSNAPRNVVTLSASWTPELGSSGLSALFYADGRMSSDYNTGSDLFFEKEQDGFFVANARIGLRGPNRAWAVEAWVMNLFDQDYQQVAFNAPFQGAGSQGQVQRFGGVGNQIFTSYLGEPRTYGLTLRTRF
ncbi:TonB-dependent receptor [Sphingomonas carotinifaciens]|uniref:Outer membrane receptor proteins, mostly Fe transport n=1 Tax=Sphingomonas carotinifaciens TaxID=1166323 RepID=A0A1G7FSQ7_9SPHN|nr:TonB-dependent receptor [Sphingomonas carotinifaciens]MWC42544.1 TonB-dependent receptor [Sphingomonas carotinifaciens]SDE78953.1 Outer membrane receptor proteins, mostly Fe transport [Sphingomonas carotinifaciens]